MSYTQIPELDIFFDEHTQSCWIRDDGESIHLTAELAERNECGEVVSLFSLAFSVCRKHPEDMQFVLRELGFMAGESGALSWYEAAVLSRWLRSVYYHTEHHRTPEDA